MSTNGPIYISSSDADEVMVVTHPLSMSPTKIRTKVLSMYPNADVAKIDKLIDRAALIAPVPNRNRDDLTWVLDQMVSLGYSRGDIVENTAKLVCASHRAASGDTNMRTDEVGAVEPSASCVASGDTNMRTNEAGAVGLSAVCVAGSSPRCIKLDHPADSKGDDELVTNVVTAEPVTPTISSTKQSFSTSQDKRCGSVTHNDVLGTVKDRNKNAAIGGTAVAPSTSKETWACRKCTYENLKDELWVSCQAWRTPRLPCTYYDPECTLPAFVPSLNRFWPS